MLQILKLALIASVFLTVFSLAMRARATDALYLVKHWKLGIGALVAMYVVVPLVAVLMCWLFDFRPPVEIALVAIAFSPMPPVLPNKQFKAGGRVSYIESLIVLSTLAAVVIAPLGLILVGYFFHLDLGVSAAKIMKLVGITILLPLVLGHLVGKVVGERGDRVSHLIQIAATVILGVAMLIIVIALAPAMWSVIGEGTLIAFVAITLAGVAAGYLFGGPNRHDKAALALAAASRHPGVSIAIASYNFPDEKLAPAAILLALLVSSLAGIPLLRALSVTDADDIARAKAKNTQKS